MAGLRDDLIAADVIGIRACIDDVANRLWRECANGGHDSARACGVSAVDDDKAIRADLNADIAAGSGDHIQVGAQLEDVEAVAAARRRTGAADQL